MQKVYTGIALANGTATVNINDVPSSMMWVVPQWSIETEAGGASVLRVGSTCTVRRNGRYVTSSTLGSGATAYGPPPIVLYSNDVLTFLWAGLTAGDEAIATIFYTETTWSNTPNPNQVV